MPKTLEELRAQLRQGLNVKEPVVDTDEEDDLDLLSDMVAVDEEDEKRPAFTERATRSGRGGKHKISADGSDAVLLFGKHSGKNVSDLAREEPGYLRWMIGKDFPRDLLDVIEHVLGISHDEVACPADDFMKKRRVPTRRR